MDCVIREFEEPADEIIFSVTFYRNVLDLLGLPPRNLQLNIGSVITMLGNINEPRLYV